MEQCRNTKVGKREIPEKTCRPAASSSTIPTYENLKTIPPGIEPAALEQFTEFQAKKRGSDKGYTVTGVKCSIATKRKDLNCVRHATCACGTLSCGRIILLAASLYRLFTISTLGACPIDSWGNEYFKHSAKSCAAGKLTRHEARLRSLWTKAGLTTIRLIRQLPVREHGAAPDDKGGGKRDVPEKTRRPTASSGTIPPSENPGVTRPGIEPGSPWEKWRGKLQGKDLRDVFCQRLEQKHFDERTYHSHVVENSSRSRLVTSSFLSPSVDAEIRAAFKIEVLRTDEGEARWVRSSTGMKGLRKRENLEKIRQPAASSGRIPTCEGPGTASQGIEHDSPSLEASNLTTTPPRLQEMPE
ncbi:hypothetical protein PR048_023955 [Dryococelus australis]|uniref:Uncharacterized protein n=1 Tax=Dryococelus australis TaxID=614101 RepID=A0ABQ9GVJ7_9NEOP|nr:hypothetical protein PR048_023955 [Dryococelus australis]